MIDKRRSIISEVHHSHSLLLLLPIHALQYVLSIVEASMLEFHAQLLWLGQLVAHLRGTTHASEVQPLILMHTDVSDKGVALHVQLLEFVHKVSHFFGVFRPGTDLEVETFVCLLV